MLDLFAKYFFDFKYHLYHPTAYTLYRNLKKSQYFTIEQHRVLETKALVNIVKFVINKIPFYQKRYRSVGFELGDMHQDGWFEKLPIVTKTDIREYYKDFINEERERDIGVSSTGGTTGVPVEFGLDKTIPFEAYLWRMMDWWGIHPWDSGAYAWRMRRTSWKSRFFNSLLWWPKQKICLDASSMTDTDIVLFIKEINRIHPPIVQGYVGALIEVAKIVIKKNLSITPPKVVWATAAPLSTVQKNLLERVFHAPVYNQYGCCEVPALSAECKERNGMHVNIEKVKMEFVEENSGNPVPMEHWGRTLLTKLDDFVFPLIRYEVGDRGRWLTRQCPCGVTLPLIDNVKGRESDTLHLPSGRQLNGEYLTTIFDHAPGLVRAFRVIQKSNQEIWLEVEPVSGQGVTQKIELVRQKLSDKIQCEVPVVLKYVDKLPHERGKLRFVISELVKH